MNNNSGFNGYPWGAVPPGMPRTALEDYQLWHLLYAVTGPGWNPNLNPAHSGPRMPVSQSSYDDYGRMYQKRTLWLVSKRYSLQSHQIVLRLFGLIPCQYRHSVMGFQYTSRAISRLANTGKASLLILPGFPPSASSLPVPYRRRQAHNSITFRWDELHSQYSEPIALSRFTF